MRFSGSSFFLSLFFLCSYNLHSEVAQKQFLYLGDSLSLENFGSQIVSHLQTLGPTEAHIARASRAGSWVEGSEHRTPLKRYLSRMLQQSPRTYHYKRRKLQSPETPHLQQVRYPEEVSKLAELNGFLNKNNNTTIILQTGANYFSCYTPSLRGEEFRPNPKCDSIIRRDLKSFLGALKQAPCIVIGPPDAYLRAGIHRGAGSLKPEVNAALQRHMYQIMHEVLNERCRIVNSTQLVTKDSAFLFQGKSRYENDGLHYGTQGQDHWAEELIQKLPQHLKESEKLVPPQTQNSQTNIAEGSTDSSTHSDAISESNAPPKEIPQKIEGKFVLQRTRRILSSDELNIATYGEVLSGFKYTQLPGPGSHDKKREILVYHLSAIDRQKRSQNLPQTIGSDYKMTLIPIPDSMKGLYKDYHLEDLDLPEFITWEDYLFYTGHELKKSP